MTLSFVPESGIKNIPQNKTVVRETESAFLKNKKEKNRMVNKKDFISKISEKSGYTKKDIANVLSAMDDCIFDIVKSEDSVRLLSGIVVGGTHVDTYNKKLPSGEVVEVAEHTRPVFRFSTTFKQALR